MTSADLGQLNHRAVLRRQRHGVDAEFDGIDLRPGQRIDQLAPVDGQLVAGKRIGHIHVGDAVKDGRGTGAVLTEGIGALGHHVQDGGLLVGPGTDDQILFHFSASGKTRQNQNGGKEYADQFFHSITSFPFYHTITARK